MMDKLPSDLQHVYFIGIAGIGMSALARYFMHEGIRVSGYDRDRSALALELEREGARIHYVDDEGQVPPDLDLAVYTPAIPPSHTELQALRSSKVPVYKRSEVLGMLSREMRCIAVAGTHGKTTTSAMIAHILRQCGLDCTAFMGGIVTDFAGNFVYGESDWVVVEADEFDRSFLQLTPEIAVVTSMDPDHLDIYGTYDSMIATYLEFIGQVVDNGCVLVQAEVLEKIPVDIREELIGGLNARNVGMVVYGDEGHLKLVESGYADGAVQFEVWSTLYSRTFQLSLGMPGRHNILNAIAAIGVAQVISSTTAYDQSIDPSCTVDAIARFKGIKRRFEIVYSSGSITVIDDYAHHPKEVEAAVEAAKNFYRGKRITGIFQPHLYSRTRDFFSEFAESLSMLDEVVLIEIYPARELPIEGVSSKLIFDVIENQYKYLTDKRELTGLLRSLDPEVLLFLGAGDLDRMIPEIVEGINK